MSSIRVLLVDDNPTFLRIATRFLEAHGELAVVASLERGSEVLGRVDELRPDVALIDLAMPDLPGLDLIPRLRAARPDLGIVALTLLDTDTYRQAALDAGADDFVAKSALGAELLPAIRRVVETGRGVPPLRRPTSPDWRHSRSVPGPGTTPHTS